MDGGGDGADDDYYNCSDDEDGTVDLDCGDATSINLQLLPDDPEDFHFTVISENDVNDIFQSAIAKALSRLPIGTRADRVKSLLVQHRWDVDAVIRKVIDEIPVYAKPPSSSRPSTSPSEICEVCFENIPFDLLVGVECRHLFCRDCWNTYLADQIENADGGFDILCMHSPCDKVLGESFVLARLRDMQVGKVYERRIFCDCVESHPNLTRCATKTCDQLFVTQDLFSNRKVDCPECHASFCFSCRLDYHLPCDCRTMVSWQKKSFEDSATMQYLSSNTKDCPNPDCQRSIEKNGGCNHMRCKACGQEFCWICLGDWGKHSKNYYECNKFSEKKADKLAEQSNNPLLAVGSQGRIAMVKYLFHYERVSCRKAGKQALDTHPNLQWKNHEQSLKFEEKFKEDVSKRLEKQVQTQPGSYIDWHFLLEAGEILIKCRRALQYTYPLAYYMEEGPQRQLFECLQADLESDIESMAYTIEKLQNIDAVALQAQMRSAEFRRRILFRDAASFQSPSTSNKPGG